MKIQQGYGFIVAVTAIQGALGLVGLCVGLTLWNLPLAFAGFCWFVFPAHALWQYRDVFVASEESEKTEEVGR